MEAHQCAPLKLCKGGVHSENERRPIYLNLVSAIPRASTCLELTVNYREHLEALAWSSRRSKRFQFRGRRLDIFLISSNKVKVWRGRASA